MLTARQSVGSADAVESMEWDGPLLGTPKNAGCLVIGRNLPAVDATCARIMELNPCAIGYLSGSSGKLGPIQEQNLRQRGEQIDTLRTRFELIDQPHLRGIARA